MSVIIDAHVHCGVQETADPQSYEDIAPMLDEAGVSAAVCFPPVAEIYLRSGVACDEQMWAERRHKAREYVCSLKGRRHRIYPFYFVWNDFDTSMLDVVCGIKWHRHSSEPEYLYDTVGCNQMLQAVRERELPVLIEEEFHNMMHVTERLGESVPIIVPHLGELNGGLSLMLERDLWSRPNLYADMSSFVGVDDVQRFLDHYGPEKLIYGSDYPFGHSLYSKETILELGLSDLDQDLIFSGNILRILRNVDRYGGIPG